MVELDRPVLIIDDDTEFCDEISAFLKRYHFTVKAVHKPSDALPFLEKGQVGFILLDVMLPDTHGFEFCKEVRKKWPKLPVLFVSAFCDTFEQVLGFEAGADDFLQKPFLPQELLARMKAILRRSNPAASKTGTILKSKQGLRLDTVAAQVWLDDVQIQLPDFQYEILRYFMKNPQRLIPRIEIMEQVMSYNSSVTTRAVDINISRIRKALSDDPDNPRFIRTVWRKGYQFIDDIIPQGAEHG